MILWSALLKFLYHLDSYAVLPFFAYLDYDLFSFTFHVRNSHDVEKALLELLDVPEAVGMRMQRKVVEMAPLLAMSLLQSLVLVCILSCIWGELTRRFLG